jgi:hypothetical protein
LLLKNQCVLARHFIGLADFAHPTLGHHYLVNLINRTKPRHEELPAALRPESKTVIFSGESILSSLMPHEDAAYL